MRMPPSLRRVAPLVCTLIFAVSSAPAQTGGLEVAVIEAADGAPVTGAAVRLTNEQGFVAETVELTDVQGRAFFPVLRGGTHYVVEVSYPGFSTQRLGNVRVRNNQTERLVLALLPAHEEQIQVTAGPEVVDLSDTGLSTRFSEEFIADLPVAGRFYQNILTLAPGVNDADGDGNPNVHGARQRDFRAEIGGISNVDPLTGQWLSFVHSGSIEEVEIVPSGAGVEFGRAQGGFARIIQTQGSNEFEGVLSILYRTSRLDGTGAGETASDLTPQFDWRQPSVVVSGPVVRDHLWFRLAHEWIRGEEPQDVLRTVEVMPRDQETASDQLTWQVSPRNKLALQYQSSDLSLGNYGISSTIPSESSYTLRRSGPSYSLSWLAPYSSRLLVDSLVAWQDHSFELTPTTSNVRQDCMRFFWFRSLETARCFSSATGLTSGSFPESSIDQRQRLTVRSDLTWFAGRFLGASQRLKFGLLIEDERFRRQLERNPDLQFLTQLEFTDPCPTGGSLPCWSPIGYTTALVSAPDTSSATATGTSWGVYMEDQIEPAANLSLTLGIRFDHEEIDSEGYTPLDPATEAASFIQGYSQSLPAANVGLAQKVFTSFPDLEEFQLQVARQLGVDPSRVPLSTLGQAGLFWQKEQRLGSIAIRNDNFSPRLTIAWDPWSHGKSKLTLSAGRYYDKIVLAVPLVELEPVSTTLLFRAPPQMPLTGPPPPNERYLAFGAVQGIAPTVRRQLVDRNLRTPYQDEIALGFEHEIAAETSVRASFIQRRFRDQLQDVDINHAPGDHGYCVHSASIEQPTVRSSPGAGAELYDPYTGERYVDSDPGLGDGRVDDCTGIVKTVPENEMVTPPVIVTKVAPDGLDDLYVLNPVWGEIVLIGNFNRADYTAMVIELIRRRHRNWEMQASYTWAKAEGDGEDFNQQLGNERNLREDEQGYLDYDQRHVLRFTATRTLGQGWRMGGVVSWQSGLPYSEVQSVQTLFSIPPEYANLGSNDVKYRQRYPTRQRNDQRNPSYWNVDLMVAKDFALGRTRNVGLSAEIFNLLEDNSLVLDDRIDGTNSGIQRFGRRYQLGVRFAF